ncbi:MAG: hypothetical protein ACLFQR_09520 [Desulfovibrionales bacterium]
MRSKILSLAAVLLFASLGQAAETVTLTIPNGFLTGSDFLEMSQSEQSGYVMGFVNGLTVSPLLGADEETLRSMEDTVLGSEITNLEYVEMIVGYIRANPSHLQRGLNILSLEALSATFNPDL